MKKINIIIFLTFVLLVACGYEESLSISNNLTEIRIIDLENEENVVSVKDEDIKAIKEAFETAEGHVGTLDIREPDYKAEFIYKESTDVFQLWFPTDTNTVLIVEDGNEELYFESNHETLKRYLEALRELKKS
ncbi:hypothetical protein BpOF4_22044 (plasmid) [Alkalihalophilus pseudofirmus OF4]|uniref:YhfM-like domain-containing protein n=1 Tax=Alkalihalophilus pseudofirmus (strain ATCC BAA-2126 / JCM 17055 / OF4) TaxID=398511 RepID=D3G228_ALKPO|nr:MULTISPECIES: hypothetical protein [Alkalihalophilus]ADC52404.1 hypothetical protein BpOF4_22044 [Alkalihalophilus pseudofirmus OF4]MED1603297.1 hypothetical protein [Alkalihalophilus marmarensis]